MSLIHFTILYVLFSCRQTADCWPHLSISDAHDHWPGQDDLAKGGGTSETLVFGVGSCIVQASMLFKNTPVCKPLKATGLAVSARQENEGQLSPRADIRPAYGIFYGQRIQF